MKRHGSYRSLFFSLLAPLLVPACAGPPAPPLADVLSATPAANEAASFRVAVAPVEVDAEAAREPTAGDTGWSPVPVRLNHVQQEVLSAVKASRAFRSAAELTAPPGSGLSVLAQAFHDRADVVLELTVRKHTIAFEGWESGHVRFWEIALDVLFGFPQWWIANELYRADVEVEARLVSVGTGSPVWKEVYRPRGVSPVRLSPIHRGLAWYWLDSFVVPGEHTLENYVRAGRLVLPHAWNSVLAQLATDLARGPFRAQGARLSKTLVLSIGVGQQGRGIPDLDVPNKDALEIGQALRQLGEVPSAHVIELTGPSATKQAVVQALGDLASRLNAGDTLIVYYAGYGFAQADGAYVVPYDFEPRRPEATAIALDEIRRVIDGVPGTHAIVLDTSFAGEEEATRTLPGAYRRDTDKPSGKLSEAGAQELGRALERLANGRTVFLAARPEEAVTRQSFDPEDKAGMFTARLLQAASLGDLDRNSDRWLDLDEVFERARRDTEELSSLFGRSQHPTRFGNPARIPFARVAEATP